MTTVQQLPPQVIDKLLDWCDRNAASEPRGVLALGLPYAYGLNAHQLAAATFISEQPVAIRYPLARRAAEIGTADFEELVLAAPDWLQTAAAAVASRNRAHRAHAVFLPRSRTAATASVLEVRKLVAKAAASATGLQISCDNLASTRAAEVGECGEAFGLDRLGYAESYRLRLLRGKRRLIIPREAL